MTKSYSHASGLVTITYCCSRTKNKILIQVELSEIFEHVLSSSVLVDFAISDSEQHFCVFEHYKISILGFEFDLLEKIKIDAHIRNWPICSVQKISWLTTYIIQQLGYSIRQQFLRFRSDTIKKQS